MANLHGIFKAAINGIQYRGTGGFVYVKADECGYMFPNELVHQPDLRTALDEMLQSESASRVFYVVEERDGNLHVLAYPRDAVLAQALNDTTASPGAGNGETVVEEVGTSDAVVEGAWKDGGT